MSTSEWMAAASARTLEAIDQLDDDTFGSPSALPGWTIGHIVAHLHFNAEAIGRLVQWASTGVETPMYSGPTQRGSDIETGSSLSPAQLRRMVHESAEKLNHAFDALAPAMWEHKVVTAQGRTVAATELVWMRFREVAVHGIDLGTGLTFADFPTDAVARLVHEIIAKRLAAGELPALAAALTGRTSAGPTLGPWL
jgi:maleylpyruvate isomerase